ncbi:hypothetical protein [Arcobacter sp. LA11]|uniref:hypothetical protein n=1 Tax=Arcobacter sp. LA11 TaxID=1898176 RepID=UPI0009355631|nr:hypothetical protein [Arcobacter sp. LA11]
MKTILALLFISLTLLIAEEDFSKVCPIVKKDFDYYSNQDVKVIIPSKFFIGKNKIEIKLSESKLPSGYNIVAFIDIEHFTSKKEPEVENGIPFSSIEFYEKGNYELLLNVNLIYRSS